MILFVKHIREQKEWDRRFELAIYTYHTQIKGEKVKSEELKVLSDDRDKP